MESGHRHHYNARARIIKAMAHPSRLMIIDALSAQELCVNDLQSIVQADMSTVSKHLSVMKNAGLVQDRKVGLQVFYSLRVPCITQFFGCVEAVLDSERERMGASWTAEQGNESTGTRGRVRKVQGTEGERRQRA